MMLFENTFADGDDILMEGANTYAVRNLGAQLSSGSSQFKGCRPGEIFAGIQAFEENGSTCTPCGTGHYMDEGMKMLWTEGSDRGVGTMFTACKRCPAGSHLNTSGGMRLSACVACGTDTFSLEASSACTACPSGTSTGELPGATSEAFCRPIIGTADTVSITLGSLFAAFTCVAVAVALTRRFGHVNAELFNSMMLEMTFLIIGICVDAADIATDVVTCAFLLQNPDLADYHVIYLVFTVFACVVAVLGLGLRSALIKELVYERKGAGRRVSFVPSSDAEIKKLRLKAIGRDVRSAFLGLTVFAAEDLPMIALNISIITSTTGFSCMDEPMLLASLFLNIALGGFKIGLLKKIKDLNSERKRLSAPMVSGNLSANEAGE